MTILTDNYSFKKEALGHPERDTAIANNLDLIDAAIKALSDTIGDFGGLASAKIVVGDSEGVAAAVDMSGDIAVNNVGLTAIGADKVLNTMLANITRGSIKVGGAADAPTDLDAKTDAQMLIGDGTDIKSVAMSGDVTIIADGTTAVGAGKVKIANLEAALLEGIVTVPLSFETGELTATKIYFPFKVVITKIRSIVMKLIEATSDATVTGNNGVGDTVVTVTKNSALNTEDSADPDAVNGAVAADAGYTLTTAKADAGGKVLVTLEYTRTA